MWIYVEAPDSRFLAKELNDLNRIEEVKDDPGCTEETKVVQVVHIEDGRALVEVESEYHHYQKRYIDVGMMVE